MEMFRWTPPDLRLESRTLTPLLMCSRDQRGSDVLRQTNRISRNSCLGFSSAKPSLVIPPRLPKIAESGRERARRGWGDWGGPLQLF